MKTTGLSLEQAPPIVIPFKFFLTASLFVFAVGLVLVVGADKVFLSRWSPLALAITHLVTLGFLAQVMTGAMIQLLPVLAGSPIPAVVTTSRIIHLMLLGGTLLLALGFFHTDQLLIETGATLSGGAIMLFLAAVMVSLIRSGRRHDNAISFGLGWLAIIPTVAIGIYMVLGLGGLVAVGDMPRLVAVHLSWGLLGWVGTVLFSTVFQLLPIFYITDEISPGSRDFYVALIMLLLMLYSLAYFWNIESLEISLPIILALFLFLSFKLFQSIRSRRRKIVDVTLLFLWSGLASLLLAALAWIHGDNDLLVAVFLLGGVCMTMPIGIIYKVIPFLCWFHLQSLQVKQGRISSRLPSMKHYISDKDAKRHYLLHITAILLMAAAAMMPTLFARLSGLLFSLASLYFLRNLLFALLRYRAQQKALAVEQ
ncbi:MAG: hypothetical protein B6D72_18620 [gamma proteobacterium symbiont of Ctena orbiculata]|uniref:Uncharacterized protein n=1 Tax=Candidatus Thiodiazotropha taylori TaxID=2792791 RepID=A0A944QWF4_9GAMM|nr:hypothetical protein [Candidatus Thiodiazotropha taylori]PUB90006.1 MAG: hypothetical protein DBP00_00985 [gamma proteobacterium symbiont of Ctena orbiculata]MBT3026866.1 hypothetical protein [Candidatus Thiodiazotropha taylori]MBT3034012.1 hypothetical protein [Candidatus Thiodiazotropha taylori]MBV2138930.1 hypothetical protein [Candidatus Thiodiazotropha taylori]